MVRYWETVWITWYLLCSTKCTKLYYVHEGQILREELYFFLGHNHIVFNINHTVYKNKIKIAFFSPITSYNIKREGSKRWRFSKEACRFSFWFLLLSVNATNTHTPHFWTLPIECRILERRELCMSKKPPLSSLQHKCF